MTQDQLSLDVILEQTFMDSPMAESGLKYDELSEIQKLEWAYHVGKGIGYNMGVEDATNAMSPPEEPMPEPIPAGGFILSVTDAKKQDDTVMRKIGVATSNGIVLPQGTH